MIVKDISEMKEMPPRMDEHGIGEEREDDGEKCNGHGGQHHQHLNYHHANLLSYSAAISFLSAAMSTLRKNISIRMDLLKSYVVSELLAKKGYAVY